MKTLSDQEFSSQLDNLERNETLLKDLTTDDNLDLQVARKLFMMQKSPSKQLSAKVQLIPTTKIGNRMPIANWLPIPRKFGLIFTLLLILMALMFMMSTTTQAMVQEITEKIGSFIFQETQAVSPVIAPKVESVNGPMTMTKSQAQGYVPFLLELPTWLPDGYNFTNQVVLAGSRSAGIDGGFLTWENRTNDNWIVIIIRKTKDKDVEGNLISPIEVGTLGAVKEVKVKSFPATIVQGHWDMKTGKWAESGLSLRWWVGEMFYAVHTSDQNISEEQLIHIAESIP